MSGAMTQAGIERAARRIGCSTQTLRAVLAVETLGSGFLPDGRPKILFERHWFHRLTGGKFDANDPDVSNPLPGGYGPPSQQYPRLYKALQLDADAAVKSASWGIGQIMGFNYALAGERTLLGFLVAMHNNEDAQLALMAECIVSMRAASALRALDWATFASIYNGPGYAQNKYDEKLAAAYRNLEPA